MPGPTSDLPDPAPLVPLLLRSALGGALMGLANLVPGISGGTMLLAAGVYPRFIEAIAEVTSLRFRATSLTVLVGVVGAAGLAILLLAGVVKDLVVAQRWMMYSLFIGLTLGGVPVVYRLLGEVTRPALASGIAGFLGMAVLGLAQARGVSEVGGAEAGLPMFLLAGLAGASAMILPGVSGGYLLLVLGMYVPILAGVDAFKEALRTVDLGALMDPLLAVVAPVGVGVVLGVVVVSHLLRWLLERHEKATLGFLLGLLLGAVVGLWPFQEGVAPELGTAWRGEIVTESFLSELDPEDYPTRAFTPSALQVGGSLVLVLLGLGATLAVARVGNAEEAAP